MNERRCDICNEWTYDYINEIDGTTVCGDCAGYSVDDEGFYEDGVFYDKM